MGSPLRRRTRAATVVAVMVGMLTVGVGLPAQAGKAIVWATACPSPDLVDPTLGVTAPMTLELVKVTETSASTEYVLRTRGWARCVLAVNRVIATQPTMASVSWNMPLLEEKGSDPNATREYSDLCDGRTVANIDGGLIVNGDDGRGPGQFLDPEIAVNGTGAELVVDMTLVTSQLILKGHGAFHLVGDHDCDSLETTSHSPRWEGVFVAWDPAFEESDDGPSLPSLPALPDFPHAPRVDLSPVAELRSQLP